MSGVDHGFVGQAEQLPLDTGEQRSGVPAGQVAPADGALEEQVTGQHQTGGHEADVPGSMPGSVAHFYPDPAQVEHLAIGQQPVGRRRGGEPESQPEPLLGESAIEG